VLKSLQLLLNDERMSNTSRLVVISSIWQNISRPNKLTYSVTKSAIKGLIQSLAIDLGQKGMLVNAVLPGALDTPMTRKNLAAGQIDELVRMTPLKSMPSLDDVASLTEFLCSPANTGITGQFISADRGFSYAKII
jgi:NAD(P)-dependent dehydrogenase (short-subunit alcohol dehydrogenase family)